MRWSNSDWWSTWSSAPLNFGAVDERDHTVFDVGFEVERFVVDRKDW